MVELFQPLFRPLMRDRVIERRGEEQHNHAAAVQAVAGDRRRAGVGVYRLHQQQHEADNTEHQPDPVADAVGNFLCQRISLSD